MMALFNLSDGVVAISGGKPSPGGGDTG